MADPSNDYFAARDQQRQWADKGDLGGYESSGLLGYGRQLRRTTGGSYLSISDTQYANIRRARGQSGGGYPSISTEGPTPKSRGIDTPQKTETIRYAQAPGVAGNYDRKSPGSGGMNFPTMNALAGVAVNLAPAIGKGIRAGINKVRGRDREPAPEVPSFSSRQTTPTGGNNVPQPSQPSQPWGPPTGDPKHGPIFLGEDQPNNWGPPTGDPKHGPIYTEESRGPERYTAPATSRAQRRPAGEQRPDGGQRPAPMAADNDEPFFDAGGPPKYYINDFDNLAIQPDTYDLGEGETLSPQEELYIRRDNTYSRRPESSGRTIPTRPGGPGRVAPGRPGGPVGDRRQGRLFNPGPRLEPSAPQVEQPEATMGELPGQQQLPFDEAPAQTPAAAPTASGSRVTGRPAPTGRGSLPNRPGGPRQAQVQQAARSMEYPATAQQAPAQQEGDEEEENGPYTMDPRTELERRSAEFRSRQAARPGTGFRYWRT